MLDYITSKEEADIIAAQVIKKIESLKLTKTPYNFELWFCYFSKKNPEITHVLDQIESKGSIITDEICYSIFEEYIDNSEKEKEILEQASDRIQQSIDIVQSMLHDAKQTTNNYGGSLQKATDQIKKADDINSLKQAISTIMTETQTMMQKNQQLEVRLSSSADQVSRLQNSLESIRHEALTDNLTNLANRKRFDQEILKETLLAKSEGYKLCLLMIDIDHFKNFNDNYGHQVGDQVLKLVASTLIKGVKGRDLAARYGGEEFSILLPDTPLIGATKVGNNLREQIAKKEIINRANNELLGKITISGGVAEYQPGETIEAFIKRADDALYSAKRNGRNKVETAHNPYIYDQKDQEKA